MDKVKRAKPDPRDFERHALRVGQLLWDSSGASRIISGSQIDGVFETAEITYLMEATIERGAAKVRDDVAKLVSARKHLGRTSSRFIKCYIIVHEPPSPDQKNTARNERIEILTIDQLEAKLANTAGYVHCRRSHSFGSIQEFFGAENPKATHYFPVSMRANVQGTAKTIKLQTIVDALADGKCVLLLGDYGTGKSMATREVFRALSSAGGITPIAVNLREHWGQTSASEVLQRHANNIGFDGFQQLVRVWRGGRCAAILDGFDELAVQSWSRSPRRLIEVRRESVAAIRDFVRHRSENCGILVTGRPHYFASTAELDRALGLPSDTVVVNLSDFGELEAKDYLVNVGCDVETLPEWMPRKPLLLAYMASHGMLEQAVGIGEDLGVAGAWTQLVAEVCRREADVSHSLDAVVIRLVLERVATYARCTASGLGPVSEGDLKQAFKETLGVDPQEDALMILLRLPGLVNAPSEDGSKLFVDDDLTDALRAGDVVRFAESPHADDNCLGGWLSGLGEVGAAVVWESLRSRTDAANLRSVREAANRGLGTMALDILASIQTGRELVAETDRAPLDCQGVLIQDGDRRRLDLDECPLENCSISHSIVGILRLPEEPPTNFRLESCLISRVEGAADSKSLPLWIADTACEEFDNTATTAGIMALSKPLPVRIALVTLKKIYVQRGHARAHSALYKGLPKDAVPLVGSVIKALTAEGLIRKTPTQPPAWKAVRGQTERALALLGGTTNGDPLFDRLDKLAT